MMQKQGRGTGIRLIIAGGGTGGHLFPAVAIAREVSAGGKEVEILFVTGRRKMEAEVLARYGFRQVSIGVEGLKGRGWKRGALTLLKLPWGLFQALSVLRGFSPHLVLGVGGYSAGPVCVGAKLMGIPCAIQEQNSFPGLTNRLLGRVVDRVFISFEESRRHFRCASVLLTGNPVRKELLQEATVERTPGGFTVLVVGGSQGARAVNDAFLSALEHLAGRGKDLRAVHQTGEVDFERISRAYREKGLPGEVFPFIQGMAGAYARADIVVSRAGATTLSELAVLGKPSILIPYPHAANRHQELNARTLVEAGGAEMILQENLGGEVLADLLAKYMDDRPALARMAERVKAVGRPDAVEIIAGSLLEMMQR
jgi:UDP-N-acetylglucosamine--N-acetylmuramyl-(pentapeptide) pyrophosphoryl-undecaprenol N-acetylglucosamine transferase